jgi:hypothetical protein
VESRRSSNEKSEIKHRILKYDGSYAPFASFPEIKRLITIVYTILSKSCFVRPRSVEVHLTLVHKANITLCYFLFQGLAISPVPLDYLRFDLLDMPLKPHKVEQRAKEYDEMVKDGMRYSCTLYYDVGTTSVEAIVGTTNGWLRFESKFFRTPLYEGPAICEALEACASNLVRQFGKEISLKLGRPFILDNADVNYETNQLQDEVWCTCISIEDVPARQFENKFFNIEEDYWQTKGYLADYVEYGVQGLHPGQVPTKKMTAPMIQYYKIEENSDIMFAQAD